MLETKSEENAENEAPKEIEDEKEIKEEITEEESIAAVAAAAPVAAAATEAAPEPPPPPPPPQQPLPEPSTEATLNPLNEQENNPDSEGKTKHRRYWTPKEEERFYEIWGRENWRLTRHGKNTIFFAKWADEMRDRFNIDIKPEEIQCKVNQTRAKFRQVKKHLDSDKNSVRWKKYDIIEKILKNQYRSKDDEPVPLEALENNRDVSPTELHNTITQPFSPNSASNISNMPEQNINLNQALNTDHHLTDEVNMSSASLSDQNLLCNSSQSGNSFSTELFGSDQLEIKQEIENDLKLEGFTELTTSLPKEQNNTDVVATTATANSNVPTEQQSSIENQSNLHQRLTQQQTMLPPPQQQAAHCGAENETNAPLIQSTNPNSLLIQNRVVNNHNNNNNNGINICTTNSLTDGVVSLNNHVVITNNNAMQPPPKPAATHTPRKRNRTSATAAAAAAAAAGPPVTSENVEALYIEEVKKRNVLLVEQGEINRKRLRLEERKVKLMEEFFPKFMNLQQEILQKLDTVTTASTPVTN